MIDVDSRLQVAKGIAKNETQASQQLFQRLKEWGHPEAPQPTISDGWGGIDDVMVAVYGLAPEYEGRGRPPTRKKDCPGWQYLQMVNMRDGHGRFQGIKLRIIYGKLAEVVKLLGTSTAYIERSRLTSRLFSGRLARKTLASSKSTDCYTASAFWEDAYYNLVRPHKSLSLSVSDGLRKWDRCTPAMAAAPTDHIWTLEELFTSLPVSHASNT